MRALKQPQAPRPEPNPKLPTWLNVMLALVALSNLLVFGLYAFAVPTGVFPDVNEAAEYPVRFFAIRHIAIAFPLIHGLIHQNRDVLRAMFHLFLVIAALDVGSILTFGWSYPFLGPLPLAVNALIGVMVFIGPMALGTWALHRE
ncbi:MAG: hypothetical protein H6741_24325 [Alphaproteobacteria bacterium]|nr:hypothetical protein [Alphaproteobacteria bacterium]